MLAPKRPEPGLSPRRWIPDVTAVKTALRRKYLPLLLLAGLMVRPSHAQTAPGSQPVFPELLLVPSARPVGMGESFTAVADDASALFYNPAGLAWLPRAEVSAMHLNYLLDATDEAAAFASPISRTGGFGMNVGFLNFGQFDRRDSLGVQTGSYNARDLTVGLGAGLELTNGIAVGFRSTWISQTIDQSTRHGLWWDLGLLTKPFKRVRAGLALKNLGVSEGGGAPPFESRWAVAWRTQEEDSPNNVWLSGEFHAVPHGSNQVALGAEIEHQRLLYFRAGYEPDLSNNQLKWYKGISLGLGVRVRQFQADYAFSLADDLGEFHRFTLSYLLPDRPDLDLPRGSIRPKATPTPGPIQPGQPIGKKQGLPNGGGKPGDGSLPPGGTRPVSLTPDTGGKNPDNTVVIKFKVEDIELLNASECLDRTRKLEQQGQYKEALKTILAAVEKDPKLEAAWLELGQLQVRMGLSAFEEALKLDPQNETLRQWLEKQKGR